MPTDPHDIITEHPAEYPGYVIDADGYGYRVRHCAVVIHNVTTQHTSDPLTNMQRAKVWMLDHITKEA